MNMTWEFGKIWNDSLELGKPHRPLKKRDRIWAGEIGGSYIDRFLKMNAVEPTNPPNPRSQRKFEAGNMMEWLVSMVLKRAGVLKEEQTWLGVSLPDCLDVSGKLDFMAGGNPDWGKARTELDKLELPEFFGRATRQIIDYLSETHPEGLKDIILECKSCSSMMWDVYENRGAEMRHRCQLYHYLKATKKDEGHILYISKDDLRLLEIGLHHPDPEVEAFYTNDVKTMTAYIRNNEKPPLEREVVFNEALGKFSSNFKVAYSNYLTMLYGFENQHAFDTKWKKTVGQWNRVLARCVAGKDMTKMNLDVLKDIKKEFPNLDELVDKLKANGSNLGEDEE